MKSDEAGQAASQVAAFSGVRAALIDYQKNFANSPPRGCNGSILDGRDIGTVICPDAPIKFYVSADIEIRAKRRHKELHCAGIPDTYEAVLAQMRERDARDSGRETAPMVPADDAIMLDTSNMTADEAFETALSYM